MRGMTCPDQREIGPSIRGVASRGSGNDRLAPTAAAILGPRTIGTTVAIDRLP
jgi:hypothetical protein